MTNQKDRELLDEIFYQMRDGGTKIINEIGTAQLAKLFDLAHRLLTKWENAEVIYKDSGADPEFWTENEADIIKYSGSVIKGVWIPVEEAADE